MLPRYGSRTEAAIICAIAIGMGMLCLAFVWLALSPARQGGFHYRYYEQQEPKARKDHCEARLRTLGYVKPSEEDQTKDAEAIKKYHDTCQQIRSAEAAEDAAFYAIWQAVVGTFGLSFVVLATLFAGLAYRETKNQAKAAWHSAYLAEDTSKRQLRAYISVTPFFITAFSNRTRASIKYRITNHGTTPATIISNVARVEILPYSLPANFTFPDLTHPDPGRFVIHPNQFFESNRVASRAFTDSEIGEITDGRNSRIYIYGAIKYTDIYGTEHFTKFCSSVAGGENLKQVAGLREYVPDHVDISFEAVDQHYEAS